MEPIHFLSDRLKTDCEDTARPYTVTISSGMVRCVDPDLPLSDYMKQADQRLYVMKKRVHRTAY